MLVKIELESTETGGLVFIDGNDISDMCVAADVKIRAAELPKITIECFPTEIMLNKVRWEIFDYEELIKASIAIMRTELMKHGDLYNGYLASINSALKEKIDSSELWHNDIFIDSEELAQAVMNRIIGEE